MDELEDIKTIVEFVNLVKKNANLKRQLAVIEKDLKTLVFSERFGNAIKLMREHFPEQFEEWREVVLNFDK